MDTSVRRNIAARDAALVKTGRVTRLIAAGAAAGSLVLMAGFAHLIPTHLPHPSVGSNGGGGSSGTSSGNGAPSNGSGPSHVTSGGS